MKDVQPVRPEFQVSHRDNPRSEIFSKSGPVTSIKVDPMVWETAIELADGDGLRIEVVSETDVRVHNRRR